MFAHVHTHLHIFAHIYVRLISNLNRSYELHQPILLFVCLHAQNLYAVDIKCRNRSYFLLNILLVLNVSACFCVCNASKTFYIYHMVIFPSSFLSSLLLIVCAVYRFSHARSGSCACVCKSQRSCSLNCAKSNSIESGVNQFRFSNRNDHFFDGVSQHSMTYICSVDF